jgi:signal transduction histidine kinase
LEGFLASIRDVTERKRMENELQQSAESLSVKNVQLEAAHTELADLNQNLEQKVRERTEEVENLLTQKDEFIRQLGHDLKSPLTPLVTLLPILREDMQDPEQQEMMDAAIQNVNFMRDLVVKTLKLARLTSGKVGPITAKARMRKQLDAVLRGRKSVADRKGVKIETSVDDGIVVQLEEIDLQELFDNTITNAIKFTPEGGTVFINAVVSEPYVTVSVRDTGIGMTGEQLSQLFHEFYKADTSRHELDSSGLGLSICKRIVERAGGKIWAESEGPGKGSTFFFTLPLSRVDSGSGEGESGVKNREGAAGQSTMIEYAAEPMATEESDRSAADLSGRSKNGR